MYTGKFQKYEPLAITPLDKGLLKIWTGHLYIPPSHLTFVPFVPFDSLAANQALNDRWITLIWLLHYTEKSHQHSVIFILYVSDEFLITTEAIKHKNHWSNRPVWNVDNVEKFVKFRLVFEFGCRIQRQKEHSDEIRWHSS